MLDMAPISRAEDPPSPEEIRAIRERQGLSREEAAAKVGITERAWGYLETGKRIPSASVCILIRLLDEEKI
jgi:transcriptional regulator with XRE-family HTH domain